MKAGLLLVAWVLVGLVVGWRRAAPPWERALAVLFWPFFIAGSFGGEEPRPLAGRVDGAPDLASLVALLPDAPLALELARRLEAALALRQARVCRLREARSRLLAAPAPADGPRGEARQRSLHALGRAIEEESTLIERVQAQVEELCTRLLLQPEGRAVGVEEVLRDLRGLVEAQGEVAGWSEPEARGGRQGPERENVRPM